MDLGFTQEQVMLQTMAADFLKRELPKERVLEIDESPTGFSPDLWKQMAGLGWAGMIIPEKYGGTGNAFMDLGVIFEALGEAACSSPSLSSAVLSAQAILEAGDDAQKQDLLPAIASGDQIVAFAYTEPEHNWGPEGVQLQAASKNGGYILNGTKLFVPDAHIADRILVVARTSANGPPTAGLGLFLVDREASGVSVRLQTGWIGDKVCEVNFENVEAGASSVIGPAVGAWPAIEKARQRGTAMLCAYMAGGARKVADMARDYSQTREAFGVTIGTFQRVQDRVIQANDDADATMWTAYEALTKLDEGAGDASASVSTAKVVASISFPRACEESHHVHGGIGTDLDFGLVHYTKRARTFQSYLGDANYHRNRIAELLKL